MTRKSNRSKARVRNIRTLDEVLNQEEPSHHERQQQQKYPPEPTLLEQLDTLLTDVRTFEQLVEKNEEWFINHISGLYMMSGKASSSRYSSERIRLCIDQRPGWEKHFHEVIKAYTKQTHDIVNDQMRRTPCFDHTEIAQRHDKVLQIVNVLDHFLLLGLELSLLSNQCSIQLSLAKIYTKTNDVDKVEMRACLELLQKEEMKVLEGMQIMQERVDSHIIYCAAKSSYLIRKYPKYFQPSTGRIQISNETAANGNDKVTWLVSFGENDTVSMERQVCSICLVDFQHDDRVLRNATKQAAIKTCTHIFHEECISKWIEQASHSSSCPCCRRPFLVNVV